MPRTKPWTAEDIAVLFENYMAHDESWPGWEAVLPGRSWRAIRRKANELGLARTERRHAGNTAMSSVDPNEGTVSLLMAGGMAPSQIDARMGWRPGRAKQILVDRWRRELGVDE